jgi:5-methylcytosine-specific restriction protein A
VPTLRWARAKTDHPSNLEAICDPCHAVKTEAEQGKRKRVKRAAGPDGWPL